MSLPKITIAIGLLLILQGVGFYFVTETKSMTALIPTFIGLPILVLGCVALKESLRKHAMHGAVALALLGLLAPIGRIASAGLKFSAAGVSLILMIVLCGGLLVLGIKSFIDARRRQASAT
jgi:peptidoglycan/LPS O-acetylase OafA/YrhL